MNSIQTLILDIDGTLIRHNGNLHTQATQPVEVLPGVLDRLREWEKKGYNIILLTGRPESLRELTEQQMLEAGIYYKQLVMGVGGGPRCLINDLKPDSDIPTATAICVRRNQGLENIKV